MAEKGAAVRHLLRAEEQYGAFDAVAAIDGGYDRRSSTVTYGALVAAADGRVEWLRGVIPQEEGQRLSNYIRGRGGGADRRAPEDARVGRAAGMARRRRHIAGRRDAILSAARSSHVRACARVRRLRVQHR